MDNKQTESELRYIPIDETVQNNPNIQIRIWDKQRSREVGYEGELELKNVKVTVPFYNSRRHFPRSLRLQRNSSSSILTKSLNFCII